LGGNTNTPEEESGPGEEVKKQKSTVHRPVVVTLKKRLVTGGS